MGNRKAIWEIVDFLREKGKGNYNVWSIGSGGPNGAAPGCDLMCPGDNGWSLGSVFLGANIQLFSSLRSASSAGTNPVGGRSRVLGDYRGRGPTPDFSRICTVPFKGDRASSAKPFSTAPICALPAYPRGDATRPASARRLWTGRLYAVASKLFVRKVCGHLLL